VGHLSQGGPVSCLWSNGWVGEQPSRTSAGRIETPSTSLRPPSSSACWINAWLVSWPVGVITSPISGMGDGHWVCDRSGGPGNGVGLLGVLVLSPSLSPPTTCSSRSAVCFSPSDVYVKWKGRSATVLLLMFLAGWRLPARSGPALEFSRASAGLGPYGWLLEVALVRLRFQIGKQGRQRCGTRVASYSRALSSVFMPCIFPQQRLHFGVPICTGGRGPASGARFCSVK
jgi:hypothetical protein